LTVILRGKRMRGTDDRAWPGLRRRGHRRSVTAGTACLREAGRPTWRRRRARQGFRPVGRDMAAAPKSDMPGLSAHGLVVVPVQVTHSLDDFASPACVRALARRVACRRHALDWHPFSRPAAYRQHAGRKAGASLRELMDRMGHSTTRAALIYHMRREAQTRRSRARSTGTSKPSSAAMMNTARRAYWSR
jgi:hypothetical protein